MNSLNILSAIGSSTPSSPARSRAASESLPTEEGTKSRLRKSSNQHVAITERETSDEKGSMAADEERAGASGSPNDGDGSLHIADEKTPLLSDRKPEPFDNSRRSGWRLIPGRITGAVVGSVRVVLSIVVAPIRYVVACFYDQRGRFSALRPVILFSKSFYRGRRKSTAQALGLSASSENGESTKRRTREDSRDEARPARRPKRTSSVASTSAAVTSESEAEIERPSSRSHDHDGPSRHTRSKSMPMAPAEEVTPGKRSIRITLYNEDALRRRKQKQKSSKTSADAPEQSPEDAVAAALKSPTSPASVSSKLTKYPRAPAPPRPLIPRRQPSYSSPTPAQLGPHQKTLIIDLDETLIHSMSRGGKYTTGHMVEVRMQQPVGIGGMVLGPQVPVLYYVHKRPHCDEFLRKVCKWYNLIIFTASVQEYADPVIDWLELERKYFTGRYYRQHCTFRNGAYVKDLGQVEPDLSKVMIVDNSPMSYMFHEDNAVPIEGWISDPTDNHLLHLIPLLEGLQYATDVRALLALRLGQPQTA